ncbi:MAG TPA: ABC transporter substrate-binding protein [Pseudonocardia sp.]|nr:ABC transporter substrate-binding protein [Pseudonocardia sp.]
MPVRSRSLAGAATAAALAVVLAGCGGGTPAAAPEGGVELVNDGRLTTCTSLPYEPFQFQEGSEIVGFDVEMIDLVAEKLGVTQEIVDTPFEGIESGEAMNIGQCDVAAAAMTINETREQNFDFSEPYFDATQALLVRADSGITDPAQLSGRRVGVQTATTGQEWAEENIRGAELVVYDDLGLLTAAALTGQVDAAVNDNVPLRDFAEQNPTLTVSAEFDTGEAYGFGVRTGNTALLEAINETIATAKADGTYDRLYEKWIGTAPA